jgi:hypothetical protein
MPKTREMSFKDASAEFIKADAALHAAKTKDERRDAALGFAVAERNARSAKARENNASVTGLLGA